MELNINKTCWESSPRILKFEKVIDLSTDVIFNNQSIPISLNKNGLMWKENEMGECKLIEYRKIINIKREKKGPGICINYLNQSSKLMKLRKLKFKFSTMIEREKWSKIITKKIKNSCYRIKSLFIFIDKISNRCKTDGKALYESIIRPILDESKISYKVKEIESKQDIDSIKDCVDNIKTVDGIIIMSGDETAGSIISNIITSFQTDGYPVKQIPIPFGILPTGYHNDISNSIWRSDDVENAFLHILSCSYFQTDILKISSIGSTENKWGFNFHYGFYNILEQSRTENKIENIVKDASHVNKIIKSARDIQCEIKIQVADVSTGHPTKGKKCNTQCSECNMHNLEVINIPTYKLNSSTKSYSSDRSNDVDLKPTNTFDCYKWIIVNSIPCLNKLNGHEFSPLCHFCDNSADIVVLKTKTKKELKKFLKNQETKGDHLTLPFVFSERICEMNIFMNSKPSWTVSNEFLIRDPVQYTNSNEIIFEEYLSENSTCDDDEIISSNIVDKSSNTHGQFFKSNKMGRNILKPIVKAYKEVTKTTYNQSQDEVYKTPNSFESDKEKERKLEKERLRAEKVKNENPVWMLDYIPLHDFKSTVNIKVYSGIVSFFGNASVN